jgi:integrase
VAPAVQGHVAASTQNQALSALLFLYRVVPEQDLPWLDGVVRAKRPARLPVVLTRDEVRAVIRQLRGTSRLMAILLHGAGLRLLECARLRVQDVDVGRHQLIARGGKGDKDRTTPLPAVATAGLARHLEIAKPHDDLDVPKGAGCVERPWALGRKYPNAGREWAWQSVFPATRIDIHRETGQRPRHHLHKSVLPRAVKEAARRAPRCQHDHDLHPCREPQAFPTRGCRLSSRTPIPCYVDRHRAVRRATRFPHPWRWTDNGGFSNALRLMEEDS